jgi:hypothetical protein
MAARTAFERMRPGESDNTPAHAAYIAACSVLEISPSAELLLLFQVRSNKESTVFFTSILIVSEHLGYYSDQHLSFNIG